MKKRLRKKKRLGEFREFGFEVLFKFSCPDVDAFLDEYIQMIEHYDLYTGGIFDPAGSEQYVSRYNASCTNEDRQNIKKWLLNHPYIKESEVCELTDSWWGC